MRQYFNQKVLTILVMGFSSGLPIGLIGSTLQAWYTVSGVSLVAIGWLTLVGQPYAFKFLWAPFLDRWTPLNYGRRRSWILITQLLLSASFFVMAFSHPLKMPFVLAGIALLVAVFSATQDTVIDAYRTELLTEADRGVGVAVNTIAYRLAMIFSSAIALILASMMSWSAMYLIMSACFLLLMLMTIIAPSPAESEAAPSTLSEAISAPLQSFFSRKNALLILFFIVGYKLCDAMALSLNTTFLIRGMGFSLLQIGMISKIVGLISVMLGSVLGGILLPYLGLYRSLWCFGILQMGSNLLYAWLAFVGKNTVIMAIAIFGENFCSGLATVAFIVFLMNLCDRRYTATHYALFSAVAAIGRIFIGPISAVLVEHIGWVYFYGVSAIIGVPALIILRYLYYADDVFEEVAQDVTVGV